MTPSKTLGPVLLAALAIAAGSAQGQPSPQPAGRACGGIGGIRCGEGEYCRIAPPQAPDKMGVCTRRPQVCNMMYAPVCGVNRKTYPNSCAAAAAGVNVAHAGQCAIEAAPNQAGARPQQP